MNGMERTRCAHCSTFSATRVMTARLPRPNHTARCRGAVEQPDAAGRLDLIEQKASIGHRVAHRRGSPLALRIMEVLHDETVRGGSHRRSLRDAGAVCERTWSTSRTPSTREPALVIVG